MTAVVARPTEAVTGTARVPGDKSISHRALMLAGLAVGETSIEGLLEAEDVAGTAAAMAALGAEVERDGAGTWHVWGLGVGGLEEPDDVIDLGNSGTGARLLMGLLAGHPLRAVITGDSSLRRRPMTRVVAPLERMGARVSLRAGGRLPATVVGTARPLPLYYRLPVPSAQVKSAILLAGLAAPGRTTVIEQVASRDHTEIMLRHFGAEVETAEVPGEGLAVSVTGEAELAGCSLRVPGDPSSAAFPLVAAAVLPGSRVRLPGIGVNPSRGGLLRRLGEMGARLTLDNQRLEGGEPVADLTVEGAELCGIEVPAAEAPSMIDEYPILAVAAALARGRTVMHGLGELRVKESDRLAAIARGLAACGVEAVAGEDSLTVIGRGGRPPGGAVVQTELDHRIAMSFLVLGLAAEQPVTIDDAAPIATSFPDFVALMTGLGARMEAA